MMLKDWIELIVIWIINNLLFGNESFLMKLKEVVSVKEAVIYSISTSYQESVYNKTVIWKGIIINWK